MSSKKREKELTFSYSGILREVALNMTLKEFVDQVNIAYEAVHPGEGYLKVVEED